MFVPMDQENLQLDDGFSRALAYRLHYLPIGK
jgi:hypothetical protein